MNQVSLDRHKRLHRCCNVRGGECPIPIDVSENFRTISDVAELLPIGAAEDRPEVPKDLVMRRSSNERLPETDPVYDGQSLFQRVEVLRGRRRFPDYMAELGRECAERRVVCV